MQTQLALFCTTVPIDNCFGYRAQTTAERCDLAFVDAILRDGQSQENLKAIYLSTDEESMEWDASNYEWGVSASI